jgi:uncharacterized protein YndB with AHSA1/START domain
MASADKGEILIARVFDAPPELVYRAFVDPDQFCQWFGPDGFSVPFESVQIDARPGGFQRFVLVSDDDPGLRSPVNATLTEVVENQLLAGHEDVEALPGTAGPRRLHLRLEFQDEPGGRTLLEVRQGPFTEPTAHETKEGWESSFAKLDGLLRRSL